MKNIGFLNSESALVVLSKTNTFLSLYFICMASEKIESNIAHKGKFFFERYDKLKSILANSFAY